MLGWLQLIGLLVLIIFANIIILTGFSQLELDHGLSCTGGYLLITITFETLLLALLIGGAS